jgi:hypothetical protein
MKRIELELGGGGAISVDVETLVVAGFTGRDSAAVQRHVDELASNGIPAPETVPEFYFVPVDLLTLEEEIEVDGDATSGEVEPVLFITGAGTFVGVGSDHTDRDREKESIAAAKKACPKIAGRTVVPLDAVSDRWDDLTLRSTVDGGVLYQQAPMSELLPVAELLERLRSRMPDLKDVAIFCGTVPLQNGFEFSERYSGELVDTDGDVLASFSYRVSRRNK